MLNRQKTIIELLKRAGRTVSRFELTKWSFLLRHEFPSAGGSAFYDFVPYQYGPFSFTLFQELDKLEATNYVTQASDCVTLGKTELIRSVSIDNRIALHDITSLLSRFNRFKRDDLIEHVYSRHPEFTYNSLIRRLAARPLAKPAVYTAGYEGRSIDSFLNLLVQNGIRRLIDVRKNPIARRYGFHRSTLQRLLGKLEIDYVHMPSLGIASEKRRELTDATTYQALFAEYKRGTLREEKVTLEKVGSLMRERPSVLVCMERDPNFCHRLAVAEVVSRLTALPIHNLGCAHECDAN